MRTYFSKEIISMFSDVNFFFLSDIFSKAAQKQNPTNISFSDYIDSDDPEYFTELTKIHQVLIYLKSVDIVKEYSIDGDKFTVFINPEVFNEGDVLIIDTKETPPEFGNAHGVDE